MINHNLKRTTFILFITMLISTSLMPQSMAEDTIQIVCTNSVLADFTSNILIDNVSIEYIMPAGACPSHFDTSPSDVSKIVNADIIISLGWEPWLESLVNKSGNTDYTEIKCSGLGEWSIPTGAVSYIVAITDGLKTALPDQTEIIQQNANEYLSLINTTAQELKELIVTNNLTHRKVVSIEWQKDFLEWIGLNVAYYYSPPERLSVQDELDVISAASDCDVSAVIDNLQSGTEFGARVASETGLSHVVFSNFPGAVPNTETYLKMISYNTDQLIKGITSFDLTSEQTLELQNQINTLEIQRNAFLLTTLVAFVLCGVLFILYKRK